MKVKVFANSEELGKNAAIFSAQILNQAIKEKGNARLLLSTGASQFDVLKSLVKENVDWKKVEMFHLDEYVSIDETHPASFRKYLKDRFTDIVQLKQVNFINTNYNLKKNIQELTIKLRKQQIDLSLIGIGENSHIAFNDPPANFDTREAFIVVNLNESCKKQQVNEGWFSDIEQVPKQAVSLTVYQIMKGKVIVSCVPNKRKAKAIKMTLENEVQNIHPATILKKHNNAWLFLDKESASLTSKEVLDKYK